MPTGPVKKCPTNVEALAGPSSRRGFCVPEGSRAIQDQLPRGRVVDYGDLIYEERWIVKGRRHDFAVHDGTERDTNPADRVPNSTPAVPTPPGRILTVRDLAEDKKFTRTYSPVDEFGVPASGPFDGTQVFSTANPELLNIVDNGDGSASIAAVGGGALGAADLTFTATPNGGGAPVVKTDTINVVAGAAEGFAVVDGPDEEVTPDV